MYASFCQHYYLNLPLLLGELRLTECISFPHPPIQDHVVLLVVLQLLIIQKHTYPITMEPGDSRGSCAFNLVFTKSVPHILEKIFLSLDYKSFKKCLKVCISWRQLLRSESYHTRAKLLFHEEISKDEAKLHLAAQKGNVMEVIKLLSCELLDVNAPTFGSTPLHEAAENGHTYLVELLLDQRAEPNKKNRFENTPLHWAVLNNHIDIVQLLLDRGALPNQANMHGQTPLHWAASGGSNSVVQILLYSGADPDKSDRDGWAPLFYAELHGCNEVAKVLLDKGAMKISA